MLIRKSYGFRNKQNMIDMIKFVNLSGAFAPNIEFIIPSKFFTLVKYADVNAMINPPFLFYF